MTPDDIKALRKELSCTAKELAQALGIDQATVLAWEKGDLFPTKPFVDKMNALRAKGPSARSKVYVGLPTWSFTTRSGFPARATLSIVCTKFGPPGP